MAKYTMLSNGSSGADVKKLGMREEKARDRLLELRRVHLQCGNVDRSFPRRNSGKHRGFKRFVRRRNEIGLHVRDVLPPIGVILGRDDRIDDRDTAFDQIRNSTDLPYGILQHRAEF